MEFVYLTLQVLFFFCFFFENSFDFVMDLIIRLTPVWRTEKTGFCMYACT